MMRLHQSKTLSHIKRFSCCLYLNGRYWRPRDWSGIYSYWKICEYFKPKSVLEIGVLEGLSLGLFFESTGDDTTFTCVDKDFSPMQKHFDVLFGDHPKYQSIKLHQIDSKLLTLDQKFDLIHIDGNHSYEYVKNDIEKVLPNLHEGSILIIDDMTKEYPGVANAVNDTLLTQKNFVPFLSSSREMFFHHVSHDANDFLDYFVSLNATDIITCFNFEYQGFTVLKIHVANFFNDNELIFLDQLKKYDL